MSNKLEPGVDVDLLVRVWGMGADGHPFFQNAHARNISNHGATLSGIEHPLTPGDIIGVKLADKKARFKVVWVIGAGHLERTKTGVQILEGQQCPWVQELAKPGKTTTHPHAPPSDNRRRSKRLKVPFPIEICDERSRSGPMRTQASDISGRGCYVETLLPLPLGTALSITFWLDSAKITTAAVVRTCDGGVGMGIEFADLPDATQQRLQRLIEKIDEDANDSANANGTS
jgi:hypothetical protein